MGTIKTKDSTRLQTGCTCKNTLLPVRRRQRGGSRYGVGHGSHRFKLGGWSRTIVPPGFVVTKNFILLEIEH